MNNTLRPDLKVIADLVPAGSRVLDIGCGEGELLSWLAREKQVDGRGMELSQKGVNASVARGLSVVQGDADVDLQYYPSGGYDYVILSQALQAMHAPQEVLRQLTRIGKHAIVSVPNFGQWKNRLYLMFFGRMPVTKTLTYQWYDTPNIHFCTLSDFVELCEAMHITIESRISVDNYGTPTPFLGRGTLANIFGEQGVFLLRG